jgi:hypothetical protein
MACRKGNKGLIIASPSATAALKVVANTDLLL